MSPLRRFFYLDEPGIASLYAQQRGEDITETVLNTEYSIQRGWKATFAKLLGGSWESNIGEKESRTVKSRLRPENMVLEIKANLRAKGELHQNISKAAKFAVASQDIIWFEDVQDFITTTDVDLINRERAFLFVSNIPTYDCEGSMSEVHMQASLSKCPETSGGGIGFSSHIAMYLRKTAGRVRMRVFGSLIPTPEGFQIKPYAITWS